MFTFNLSIIGSLVWIKSKLLIKRKRYFDAKFYYCLLIIIIVAVFLSPNSYGSTIVTDKSVSYPSSTFTASLNTVRSGNSSSNTTAGVLNDLKDYKTVKYVNGKLRNDNLVSKRSRIPWITASTRQYEYRQHSSGDNYYSRKQPHWYHNDDVDRYEGKSRYWNNRERTYHEGYDRRKNDGYSDTDERHVNDYYDRRSYKRESNSSVDDDDLLFGAEAQPQQEQELATKMLQIQHKRFYLDVKQNQRGRFIKVAEITGDGRRNQIFLSMPTAVEFRDKLNIFIEFYSQLGPPNPDTIPEDGKYKSEIIVKDNRRYYMDLKENSRGRFLRVSQMVARTGTRSQVAIPAQGIVEVRDALTDLIDEFGTEDGVFKGELPESRQMRVDNKNFYFDIGQNNRGVYMRLSEVKANFRAAITIPEKSWSRFRDYFIEYCEKMKESAQKENEATSDAAAPSSSA